jgi:hypothetical protein
MVERSFDPDESYFSRVHPKLSSALRRIRNTRLVLEREAAGGPLWWEESDPDEDPQTKSSRNVDFSISHLSELLFGVVARGAHRQAPFSQVQG